MKRSTKAFCHGDRGAVRTSVIPFCPIARLSHRSRCAVVIVKKAAETRTPTDATDRAGSGGGLDQCVGQALMIPLAVIMRDVFGDCLSEVALADRDDSTEALFLDRSHEALRVRVRIRRPIRRLHDANSSFL
jgi:hypothetical protein